MVGPLRISVVAKALRLQWSQLKEQVERDSGRSGKRSEKCKKKASAFVELRPTAARENDLPFGAISSGAAALEIERADGSRIKLYPDALANVDIAKLIEQFALHSGR